MATNYAQQSTYDVRFAWGLSGLHAMDSGEVTVIIVDVLSFSTAVSVALSRKAGVLPFPWRDARASEYARLRGALLADARGAGEYSLSPTTLLRLPLGTRIVLPSPNGATLCFESRSPRVIAGCFRNRAAVTALAQSLGKPVAVIAAGERWTDGSLRPTLEDWLGAGAIISLLGGRQSPEAQSTAATYDANEDLLNTLLHCASGLELIERGYRSDVEIAAELDTDKHACLLENGAFTVEGTH